MRVRINACLCKKKRHINIITYIYVREVRLLVMYHVFDRLYACMDGRIDGWMCIHAHVYIHKPAYINAYVCLFVYIRTFTRTHACAHVSTEMERERARGAEEGRERKYVCVPALQTKCQQERGGGRGGANPHSQPNASERARGKQEYKLDFFFHK